MKEKKSNKLTGENKQEKKIIPEVNKEKQIKELLVTYNKLEKKSVSEGRRIRRKLRRLRYYLSKQE